MRRVNVGSACQILTRVAVCHCLQLVERMDKVDWTEGITIRQVRAQPQECPTTSQLGACLPATLGINTGSKESYGYNETHPDAPRTHPFVHFTADELGSNPNGMVSAAIPSMKT